MEEIWKIIENSDGHYYISNMGRLKRDSYEFYDTLGKKLKREEKYWEQGFLIKRMGIIHIDIGEQMGKTLNNMSIE